MKYIERNPKKCFGMPSLINRRITVYDLTVMLFLEEDIESYLLDIEVDRDQANEALVYCSNQLCKLDNNDELPFCDGCMLRTIAENYTFEEDLYYEVKNDDGTIATFSKDDGLEIFGGSILEYKKEEEGRETWKIANELLEKYFGGSVP